VLVGTLINNPHDASGHLTACTHANPGMSRWRRQVNVDISGRCGAHSESEVAVAGGIDEGRVRASGRTSCNCSHLEGTECCLRDAVRASILEVLVQLTRNASE
jgi:hypothetical protein